MLTVNVLADHRSGNTGAFPGSSQIRSNNYFSFDHFTRVVSSSVRVAVSFTAVRTQLVAQACDFIALITKWSSWEMNNGKTSKSQWVFLGRYSQSQTGRTPTLESHEETRGVSRTWMWDKTIRYSKNPSKEAALPLTHLCKSPVVTQATVGMFFVFHEVGSCIIRGVISFLEKSHFILLWAKLYSSCHLFPTFSSASLFPAFPSLLDPSCISLPIPSDYHTVHDTFELEGLSRKKKKGGEKVVSLFWISFIPKSLSKSVISSFLIGEPSKKGDAKIWNGQDIM